jgi:hypothetical protein
MREVILTLTEEQWTRLRMIRHSIIELESMKMFDHVDKEYAEDIRNQEQDLMPILYNLFVELSPQETS